MQMIKARTQIVPYGIYLYPDLSLLACCIRTCLTSSIRERMDLGNIPVFYWAGSSMEKTTGGHLSTIT